MEQEKGARDMMQDPGLLESKCRSAQRVALCEINVDTLVLTRLTLTWSPKRIEKGEARLFLCKTHTVLVNFKPGKHK